MSATTSVETPLYVLRRMHLADVPQVAALDAICFSAPWTAQAYTFEISDNPHAYMIALVTPSAIPNQSEVVIGYGGMWLIEGEAHISTIAVRPADQGKGLGDVLLIAMLRRALTQRAAYAILEVRVGNATAIALYHKHEFVIVGRQKNYYRETGEDAYLMHLAPLNDAYHARLIERQTRLAARLAYRDDLSAG
ncbi:MAG TPA: ribosomal protein S18-alanine N-acetyltransferase [Aggregatilineales bacterium]|nr:ribosomal protein S18-alanine N-acetyltransferase [Anaerolineales bacterium]HRE47028.1 ribosomal protein S18-alanine N-acetyltransferase [Aggregatilineales bacterium]